MLAGQAPPVVVEISGVLTSSGSQVNALYVGSGINQGFLVGLVMEQPSERRRQVLGGYREVRKIVAAAQAGAADGGPDVILTDLPALWGILTPRKAQYRFPAWVRQELTLPRAGTRWVLPRSVERQAARFVRRHEYTVDFVTDVVWLRRFFHELYRPYVLARFAGGAILVSEEEFLREAHGCTLARLYRRDSWAAAVLLERVGDTLRFRWFGAAGNPPPPGASDVLDVACIRHAHAAGVRRIQLGHSRPSLTDGVVRYKAKLGARLYAVRYPQAVLGITVNRHQQALFDSLNSRRLITIRSRRPRILQAS